MRQRRGCPKAEHPSGRTQDCPVLEVDVRTLHVIQAARQLERGLLTLDDMDYWYYEAAEYSIADRARLMESRMKPKEAQ